jgi:hypothetical protein
MITSEFVRSTVQTNIGSALLWVAILTAVLQGNITAALVITALLYFLPSFLILWGRRLQEGASHDQ